MLGERVEAHRECLLQRRSDFVEILSRKTNANCQSLKMA